MPSLSSLTVARSRIFFLALFAPPTGIGGGVVGSLVKPADPGEHPRRRWSLGRCMAIIALIGLLLALARPFIVWDDGDGASAESATVVPAL